MENFCWPWIEQRSVPAVHTRVKRSTHCSICCKICKLINTNCIWKSRCHDITVKQFGPLCLIHWKESELGFVKIWIIFSAASCCRLGHTMHSIRLICFTFCWDLNSNWIKWGWAKDRISSSHYIRRSWKRVKNPAEATCEKRHVRMEITLLPAVLVMGGSLKQESIPDYRRKT